MLEGPYPIPAQENTNQWHFGMLWRLMFKTYYAFTDNNFIITGTIFML